MSMDVAGLVERLTKIDETEMYDAPATTYSTVQDAISALLAKDAEIAGLRAQLSDPDTVTITRRRYEKYQNAEASLAEALEVIRMRGLREQTLHELLEKLREQIRLGVKAEHRPDGLFANIQNAVYIMRGRDDLEHFLSKHTKEPGNVG